MNIKCKHTKILEVIIQSLCHPTLHPTFQEGRKGSQKSFSELFTFTSHLAAEPVKCHQFWVQYIVPYFDPHTGEIKAMQVQDMKPQENIEMG